MIKAKRNDTMIKIKQDETLQQGISSSVYHGKACGNF